MTIKPKVLLIQQIVLIAVAIGFTLQAEAAGISTRSPTNSDRKVFQKILTDKNVSLYAITLLSRQCFKSSGGWMAAPNGATAMMRYDVSRNILKTENTGGSTKESYNKGFDRKMKECPSFYSYERIKTVLVSEGRIIGWLFSLTEDFCQLPIMNFGSRSCKFEKCGLNIPSGTETILLTPYKRYGESIRKSLNPVRQIDRLDRNGKQTCTNL